MLSGLYKLPKALIAFLFIIGAIVLMLLGSPPHDLCDSQIEHFEEIQKGFLYEDSSDFHEIKSKLERQKKNCETENSPGSCYEYFSVLQKLLKDFFLLSPECKEKVFSIPKVKASLEEALTLMTALAWRKDLLYGRLSKFNWLKRPDMFLYCKIKTKYILEYGQNSYEALETKILDSLPADSKNKELIYKWSLLSESCLKYR